MFKKLFFWTLALMVILAGIVIDRGRGAIIATVAVAIIRYYYKHPVDSTERAHIILFLIIGVFILVCDWIEKLLIYIWYL